MAWLALRVSVPSALGDAVADFLVEAGAPAVIKEDGPQEARLEAHVSAEHQPRLRAELTAYLAAVGASAEPACETIPLGAVDWEAEFRRHHRRMAVGRRLMVAPPWDAVPMAGRELLVIEPGMAFGTGQHATTRGCLEEIERALAAGQVARALDVGTGSGILAAALARLGVPHVVAIDCDPAVLPLARSNLEQNGAARVHVVGGTADCCRGRFDLVVANLLADTVVPAAGALAERTAPAGNLVLSGILADQLDRVLRAFPGWTVAGVHAENEWRTVRLVRDVGAC